MYYIIYYYKINSDKTHLEKTVISQLSSFTMNRIILYRNEIFRLNVDPSESDEFIYERIKFIIKNRKNNEYDEKLILLSKLYCNNKFFNIQYPAELFNN